MTKLSQVFLFTALVAMLSLCSFAEMNLTLVQNITGFSAPAGLFVDPQGVIYVVDSGIGRENSTLWNFDENYSFIGRSGSWGSDVYQFITPSAFFIDSSGKRYIADPGNNRVLVYGPGGSWLDTFGEGGKESYALDNPRDVFVDSERVLVTDSNNDRILVFNRTTRKLSSVIGLAATGDQKLFRPQGIFLSGSKIYLTDYTQTSDKTHGRVVVLDYNYNFIGAAGRGVKGVYLEFPEGLYVDFFGRIFVADTGNNRIQVFWPDLTPMVSFGNKDVPDFNFSSPQDVFIYKNKLFVADTGNKRVMVYEISETSSLTPEFVESQINAANNSLETLRQLNATTAPFRVSIESACQNDFQSAVASLSQAREFFSLGDYPNGLKNANDSLAFSSSAYGSLASVLSVKLSQHKSNLSARLDGIESDIRDFNISLSTATARQALAESDSLIRVRDFASAIQQLNIANIEVFNLEISLEAQTRFTRSLKESAAQSIAYASTTSENLSQLSSRYNVSINTSNAMALSAEAQVFMDQFNFVSANEKAQLARTEIDSIKSFVLQRVSLIDNASIEISDAEKEISAAESKSSFFPPNLSEAKRLVSRAKSLLYSEPETAMQLALQAEQAAGLESANADFLQPLVTAGIGGLVLLAVLLAVFYFYSSKKKKEEAKLEKKHEEHKNERHPY